jgi:hypothetical protein
MPKQVKHSTRPKDINQIAHRLVELSPSETVSNPDTLAPPSQGISQYMSIIGRKGGQIGGKRRLKTMTSEQRRKAASKAAKARWKKARGKTA